MVYRRSQQSEVDVSAGAGSALENRGVKMGDRVTASPTERKWHRQ